MHAKHFVSNLSLLYRERNPGLTRPRSSSRPYPVSGLFVLLNINSTKATVSGYEPLFWPQLPHFSAPRPPDISLFRRHLLLLFFLKKTTNPIGNSLTDYEKHIQCLIFKHTQKTPGYPDIAISPRENARLPLPLYVISSHFWVLMSSHRHAISYLYLFFILKKYFLKNIQWFFLRSQCGLSRSVSRRTLSPCGWTLSSDNDQVTAIGKSAAFFNT